MRESKWWHKRATGPRDNAHGTYSGWLLRESPMASWKAGLRITFWPNSSTPRDYCVRLFLARHNLNICLPQTRNWCRPKWWLHWSTAWQTPGVWGLLTGTGMTHRWLHHQKSAAPWETTHTAATLELTVRLADCPWVREGSPEAVLAQSPRSAGAYCDSNLQRSCDSCRF